MVSFIIEQLFLNKCVEAQQRLLFSTDLLTRLSLSRGGCHTLCTVKIMVVARKNQYIVKVAVKE